MPLAWRSRPKSPYIWSGPFLCSYLQKAPVEWVHARDPIGEGKEARPLELQPWEVREMAKAKIGVALDEELAAMLDRMAEKTGASRSELVERLLTEAMDEPLELKLAEAEAMALEATREEIGARLAVVEQALEAMGDRLNQAEEEKKQAQAQVNELATKLDLQSLSIQEIMALKTQLEQAKERLATAEEVMGELTTRKRDLERQKDELLAEGWKKFITIFEPMAADVIDEEAHKIARRIVELQAQAHRAFSRTRKISPKATTELIWQRLQVLVVGELPSDARGKLAYPEWWLSLRKSSGKARPFASEPLHAWLVETAEGTWQKGLSDKDVL